MHEMALCESIVQQLEEQASVHAYSKVKAVNLAVGPLSCADADALRFSFDVCAKGSIADGASLNIEETQGTAWCFQCGDTVSITSHADACPRCGSRQLQVTGGDELKIKNLEVV